jgi:hypothetical protein
MATSQNVDFSNVKDGGNFNRKRIPAGDYLATVTKIEDAEAKDGVFQYLVSVKINKHPASVLPYYCKLQENQLWKLRNLLIAAGLTVPKRRVKVDPNRLVGKLIGVTVEDDDYDGKEQSTIAGVFPAAELGEDGNADADDIDDDEAGGDDDLDDIDSAPEEDEEEPEEEPEAEDDPYAGLDRTALKAELKKRDADFKARTSQSDDDLRDLLRAGDGAEDDEDLDDEEEEEPAPVAKRTVSRKKTSTTTKKKPINEVSDDELEELNIDDL